MNLNLFRREWKGSVQALKESIADGSPGTIHSFCKVSNPGNLTNFMIFKLFFPEGHLLVTQC